MTGIFGVVGRISTQELQEMGRRLAHRGAQARWWQPADNIYLGQVATESPSLISSGALTAVVDRPGVLCARVSEQAVLDAYVSAGVTGLDRLSIPFAFAAWEASTQTLILGRDLAGLKPLFMSSLPQGGGIAFATEYKSLLAIDAVPAEPDLDAIQYLQVFKLAPPGSATLLKNVFAVPPSGVVRFDRAGRQLSVERMKPVSLNVDVMQTEEASKQLRERLLDATRLLVSGQSRIAVALSGGVDSLGLAHLCRECAPEAELVGFTFSQGAEDPEVRIAEIAMRELGGQLVPITVASSDLVEKLPLAVWHLEDPVGRTESYLFFEVAKQASLRGFDALLSGMGADALFAGMPRYKVLWLANLLPWLRDDLLQFFDATQTGKRPERLLARLMTSLYYKGNLPFVPRVLGAQSLQPEPHVSPGPEYLNRALLVDVLDHASRTLPRIERPLYAYGLDHGSPFFDRQVIDFSFRIPSRLKIRRGKEKYILRRALQSMMSERLRDTHKGLMRMRQETGFATALQTLAEHYLNPTAVAQRGWFSLQDVAAIRAAGLDPKSHHERLMRLWTLILTEIWAQTFIDHRGRCA